MHSHSSHFVTMKMIRHNTGLPAYCALSKDFQYKEILFEPKNCHCRQNVTLTGVTVSEEACNPKVLKLGCAQSHIISLYATLYSQV